MRTPPSDVVAAAQAAQRATGILASVTLGQWALESAWGAKATGTFNTFGIKAAAGQSGKLCATHEVVGGKSVAIKALFRNFDSVAEAFAAHAHVLCDPRFAAAAAHKADVGAFVRAISLPNRPAYATDPDYADKLLELIRVERFARFDLANDS